jgi:hypothetical protein
MRKKNDIKLREKLDQFREGGKEKREREREISY